MLFILGATVLITTFATELSARRGWMRYWVARKLLHFVAVGACAVAALYVERTLLLSIVAGAEVVLLVLILSNKLMREESGRRAWGIVWFPLAYLILLLTVRDDRLIAFAMTVLAVCDPAATVAGKLLARDTYRLTGDPKSLEGNAGFLASFLVLVALHWPFGFNLGIVTLLLIGVALTAAEALGSRGLDNLVVPLLTAYLYTHAGGVSMPVLMGIALAVAVFSWGTVRRGSLTAGGALTAGLLGVVVILGTGGIGWLWPLVFFLFGSSLLERTLGGKPGGATDVKQGRARDATQVLANGGLYGFFAATQLPNEGVLYPTDPWAEAVLLAIMAAATADTWSSVVGQRYGRRAVSVLTGRTVPAGLSGGVSWVGTAAGLAGALALVASSLWLLTAVPTRTTFLLAVGAGFAGMLVDSVLGALLQATYRDPATGEPTDRPGPGYELVSGYRWATNDVVNFLALGAVVLLVKGIGLLWG